LQHLSMAAEERHHQLLNSNKELFRPGKTTEGLVQQIVCAIALATQTTRAAQTIMVMGNDINPPIA
jgi:hypothetical protein